MALVGEHKVFKQSGEDATSNRYARSSSRSKQIHCEVVKHHRAAFKIVRSFRGSCGSCVGKREREIEGQREGEGDMERGEGCSPA